MAKHTNLKYCLYITILIGLAFALPVNAQPERLPKSQETLQCENGSVSRYEMWVKDLPCVPPLLPSVDSIPEADMTASTPDWVQSRSDYTYLVFSSYRDGNWEIYGATSPWTDGALDEVVRMTAYDSSDLRPRLRPGSTQVVFASDRSGNYELYLMDWGGGNLQQLTWNDGYDSQAAWSPDGSRLALVDELDGNLEIAVMKPDGTGWTRLTNDSADDFNPSWSPDGEKLVWVRVYDESHGVIYTMNADGTNQQAITAPLAYAGNPGWSGDGTVLAFDFDMNLDYYSDLVRMNADGSNLTLVKGGEYLVDYLAGSWTGLVYDGLLFTQIKYVIYDGNLYISKMCVGAVHRDNNDGHCYTYSYRDMYPDAAVQDLSIPETQILHLPEYVRQGNVPITTIGYDSGPAGIYYMSLEYSDLGEGIWNDVASWEYELPYKVIYKYMPHNHTLAFRLWGIDFAGHRESFPDEGYDTFTHVYFWELSGKVSDNRGRGVALASVFTDPVFADQNQADLTGGFHRFVPDTKVTLAVDQAGYGTLPTTNFVRDDDLQFTWILPPLDNLVTNGDFEDSLDGWTISGESLAALSVPSHSGSSSVALGIPTQAAGEAEQVGSKQATYSGSISQYLSIPAEMNRPTLSFMSRLVRANDYGDFSVHINDTEVYSTTGTPGIWQHVWLDLSAWQSQTVKIKFSVSNDVYQNYMEMLLDEISLGSWNTPLVEDVIPLTFDARESVVLTITGENFSENIAVRLGETEINDVVWVDEHTLRVEVPGGLPLGIYSVWVINNQTWYGVWPGYLRVGELRFVPSLVK